MGAGDSLKNALGSAQKDAQDGLKKASNAIASGESLAQQKAAAAEKKAQQDIAQAQQKFAQAEQKAQQEIQQAQQKVAQAEQKLAEEEKKAQQLEAAAQQAVQQAQKELQQAQQQLADLQKKAQQELAAAQKLLAEEVANAKQKLAQAEKLAQQLESKVQQTVQQAQQQGQALENKAGQATQAAQQESAATESASQKLISDASKGGLSDAATNSAAAFANLNQTFSSAPVDSTTKACTNPSKYSTPLTATSSPAGGGSPGGDSNPKDVAKNFYKSTTGWPDDKIDSHLEGIDFSQPVEVVTLPPGTPAVQFQIPGRPTGNYFAPPGTSPQSIGVDPTGRVPTTLITNRAVQVLRSIAANTRGNKNLPPSVRGDGGGTQYFCPDTSAFGK